jgi:hypothetical protein
MAYSAAATNLPTSWVDRILEDLTIPGVLLRPDEN